MGKTKTAFVGLEPETKKRKEKPEKKADKVHISGLKGGQRVKIVETEPVGAVQEKSEEKKKEKKPRVRGKKYQDARAKIDREKLYALPEAIKLVKETSFSKFDGTMELHIVVKKKGLSVTATLPFSFGKTKKVEVASEETVKKLKSGKIDFDVLLATAEFMPKLVPFAKLLGPKGLMPNPKNGTLIKNPKEAEKFSGSNLSLKTEKEAPLVHTTIGKVSQKDTELAANTKAVLEALGKTQLVRAFMKSTMSPSVKLAI